MNTSHRFLKRVWRRKFAIGAFMSLALIACQPKTSDSFPATKGVSPSAILIRKHGVLYVRDELRQAQLGVSTVLGGGEFRDLTTSHEWWIDIGNLQRMKRVTVEWLGDGAHLVGADGSDGTNRWWQIDVTQNITQPLYHESKNPFRLSSVATFLNIFSQGGQQLIEAVQERRAKQIGTSRQAPWGKVFVIRSTDPRNGQVTTWTVRADPPYVVTARITLDKDGNLFESDRLTNWEWLDPTSLGGDFWMIPPKGVPVGIATPAGP